MKTRTRRIRAERSAASALRQIAYDKLTTEQKIAKLPRDGARKQRAKLEERLKQEKRSQ
jgi:hypothetical protein